MTEYLTIFIGQNRVTAATVSLAGDRARIDKRASKDVVTESASPDLLAGIIGELARGLEASGKMPTAVVLGGERFSWRLLREPQVKRRHRLQALSSAFEELSGTPIEQLHIVPDTKAPNHGLLVMATDRDWLAGLLGELEHFGLRPDILVPDAVVASQVAASVLGDGHENGLPGLITAELPDSAQVISLEGRRITGWQTYDDLQTAQGDLARWRLSEGLPDDSETAAIEMDEDSLLTALAKRLRQGQSSGNLCCRQFSSARSQRRAYWHAAAAMFLLAGILVALAVPRYQDLSKAKRGTRDILAAQRQAWAEVCPGQPMPPSLTARLESDVIRLRALAGESADAPSYRSARDALEHVLANLPLGMRLDVAEIRVDQRDLTIRGETSTHASAERIAKSIDSLPGFRCPLPRSDVLAPGRVTFVIHASLIEKEAADVENR